MAEVSNISRFHQQNPPSTTIVGRGIDATEEEADPNFGTFDFDLLSPPNPSFIIPSKNENFNFTTVSESEPETQGFESVHSDHNFLIYGPGEGEEEVDEEDEQMNFVTDLFGTSQGSYNERNFIQSGSRYRYMDDEPALILGLGSTSTITSIDGLRVVDMDSESDSEAMEVDSAVDHDGLDQNDYLGSPGFWDCLQFDNQRERASFTDEFEWEEVNIRENLTSLIDRVEQLSISSFNESSPFVTEAEEEEEEENARNVEWQVLLAINNLELGSGYDEYNVQFGELVGDDSGVRGSPPAAKSVVESLPSIVLTMEDLENNLVCAVCKDDIPVGLNVTKLPCCHQYHKDCILQWLAIRNTCPLCRHELPTDYVDYERRKNRNRVGD